MDKLTKERQEELMLEIVYLFIAPVVLIYLGIIPVSWRVLVLLVVTLFIVGIMRHQRWSREEMGIRRGAHFSEVFWYSIVTLIGVFAIIFYAKKLHAVPLDLDDFQLSWKLILFFIPLSVLQEVAYRSFLMHRLQQLIGSRIHRVLINTGLFTLLHIIYPLPILMLPVAFAGGYIFALLYDYYPNLALVSIAHSILNFVAVLFGFFTIS